MTLLQCRRQAAAQPSSSALVPISLSPRPTTAPPRSHRSQSLGELYSEVGNAVLDSTDEVPSMFRERQLRRTQKPPRAKGGAVAAPAGAVTAVGRGARRGGDGRAVLDVAMPGASYTVSVRKLVRTVCDSFSRPDILTMGKRQASNKKNGFRKGSPCFFQ